MSKIKLRTAELKDAKQVYEWRSNPIVIHSSLNMQVFSFDSHEQWFKKALDNPNLIILIALYDDCDCGVVRFDLIASDTVEVSIYLAPEFIGKHIGRDCLQAGEVWLKQRYPAIKKLSAKVLSSNSASQKLFSDLDYKIDYYAYLKELHV